jgi:hypothetical protein
MKSITFAYQTFVAKVEVVVVEVFDPVVFVGVVVVVEPVVDAVPEQVTLL